MRHLKYKVWAPVMDVVSPVPTLQLLDRLAAARNSISHGLAVEQRTVKRCHESWCRQECATFFTIRFEGRAASGTLGFEINGQVRGDKQAISIAVRLASSAVGLAGIALAVAWVHRAERENRLRSLIAASLLLFLPVHLYMSAMLGEEVVLTTFVSLVLAGLIVEVTSKERKPLSYAAGLGVIAGLAWLTKLTGVLVVGVAAAAYVIDGMRRRDLARAVSRAASPD